MKERNLDYMSSYSSYPTGLLNHVEEVMLNNQNGFMLPDVYTDLVYCYHLEQQTWRTPSYDPFFTAKTKTGWKESSDTLRNAIQ